MRRHADDSTWIGRECGASLGNNRALYQGLFLVPHTVAQATKTAVFAAKVMELLGYRTDPMSQEIRHDIIQMIHLETPEAVERFCHGIQSGAPVDSLCYARSLGYARLRLPGHHGRRCFHSGRLHRTVR